jgi:hypothetical protein
MNLTTRKISEYLIMLGVICCLLAAIWSPEEIVKWLLSAIYLILVGKYFGITYRKEKVVGIILKRSEDDLNFLNLRKVL